ncbi:nuclease-related domain-containing protein [Halobacillus sp. A5]|uniref:nuclease-related domain-containing protein n=1 Tax=Halobacillus sp. A5 TaxID=2880263 RepID=UPI0020A66B2E|nr:nuclease-related domain-containing protein [Halobacillus sp. A5]MCP3029394.1 NERD domain-containing protein [Halobacillus sp. A5]
MIVKQRRRSSKLKVLYYLLEALPESHPVVEQVKEEVLFSAPGERGEESLDFHLDYLDPPFLILHNLRLFDGLHYFQIDTLLMFPQFILLLEVKNISGELTYDTDHHQLIRTKDGDRVSFPDSIEQVDRQQILLKKWLRKNCAFSLPVESLVVLASAKSPVEITGDNRKEAGERMVRRHSLLSRVKQLRNTVIGEEKSMEELSKVAHRLKSAHEPYVFNYRERFKLSYEDLHLGVRCPDCHRYRMKWQQAKWLCRFCGEQSKDVHHYALERFSYLVSETISNREAREFLGIESRYIVKRLLKHYPLVEKGAKKGARYQLR